MNRRIRTTALALAGAVALASGAYALGSQAGDGAAAAAKSSAPPAYGAAGGPREGHRHGGFDDLATRLGVSEDKLRAAFEDIAKTRRADVAQKLADALNVDRAKVDAAFEKLRPERGERRHHDFAPALARALGLSVAKVRAALDQQPGAGHHGDPTALAKALGVSIAKLRQAFATVFREHGPHGDRHHGRDTAALAKALGVTRAQLNAAFAKLRADLAQERDQLATELAKRLGLDASKVKQALETSKPFFRGRPGP